MGITALVALMMCLPIATFAKSFLDRATFTDLGGSVWVLEPQSSRHTAALKEEVGGSALVQTENRSRAEMEFVDRSLIRLGANAVFSFHGASRQMNLDEGSLFLKIPKGLGVGTEIQTAAATVAITGTTLAISATRSGDFSIVVIEGSVEVRYRDGGVVQCKTGQKTSCKGGGAAAGASHEPVVVDLAEFMATSPLIVPFQGNATPIAGSKGTSKNTEDCDDHGAVIRDSVRETARQVVRDTTRESVKENVREVVRTTTRDNVKEGVKTTTKETSSEGCKDTVRSTARANTRDSCRGGACR